MLNFGFRGVLIRWNLFSNYNLTKLKKDRSTFFLKVFRNDVDKLTYLLSNLLKNRCTSLQFSES